MADTNRVFRVPDDLWNAAQALARRPGQPSVSEVLREALRRFVESHVPEYASIYVAPATVPVLEAIVTSDGRTLSIPAGYELVTDSATAADVMVTNHGAPVASFSAPQEAIARLLDIGVEPFRLLIVRTHQEEPAIWHAVLLPCAKHSGEYTSERYEAYGERDYALNPKGVTSRTYMAGPGVSPDVLASMGYTPS